MNSVHTSCYQHVEPRRHYRDEDRWYDTDDGPFPGITTVLSVTRVDPPALRKWKKNASPEQLAESEQKKIKGGERGEALHKMVEAFTEDGIQGHGPWWDSLQPFLGRLQEVYLQESAVHHREVGYAGTLDLLGVVDGVPELLDWKTSSKPKKRDWIQDYLLQAAAYVAAVRKLYGPVVEQARIVIALEDRQAQEVVLKRRELQELWPEVRRRVARYQHFRRAYYAPNFSSSATH